MLCPRTVAGSGLTGSRPESHLHRAARTAASMPSEVMKGTLVMKSSSNEVAVSVTPPSLPAPTPAPADQAPKEAQSKQRLLLLYTGGTMGMKPDPTSGGLKPIPGYFTEQILGMAEMQHPRMPSFDILEYDPLLDSACMGPHNWVQMAEDIEKHYYNYDGFVIIMGTDTMAYAASALSFMLENLGKIVVFTGSQIPFCEVYNDARRNLIISMIFAASTDFAEVCIFFNDRLLRGVRSSKVNSFGLDAFNSLNFPPLALVGVTMELRTDLTMPPPRSVFRVHKKMDTHILVIKLVPGFSDEAIMAIINHSKTVRAIIFEMYGTGNAPSTRAGLLDAVRTATGRGIVVVALTQCRQGGVLLSKYEVGQALQSAGIVSGGDMTTEAAATKLAYLFGRLGDSAKVKEVIGVNLRGELSPTEKFEKNIYSVEGRPVSKL